MDNFFLLFFVPSIMIILGLIFWRFTPKKNNWFGYRTPNSLKDCECWDYANKTSGLFWFWTGVATLIISITIYFLFNIVVIKTINFVVDIVVLLLVVPYTEIKLGKKLKTKK